MRLPLLLCLILTAAAAAADREVLTLTDGRTLTGVYDADAGTIAMDGKAVVKVRADQVKARELAPQPKSATAAMQAGEPAAPLPKAAKPAPPRETAATILAESAAAEAAEGERHKQAAADLFQQRRSRVAAWLMKANLDPLPLKPIGSDPRQSELLAHALAEQFNERLGALRSIRDQAANDPARAASADAVLCDMRSGPMLELLGDR
jgi:hypothetical protein